MTASEYPDNLKMSIFRPSENFKHKKKRYDFIHFVFKDKFVVPIVKFIEKRLRKVMINKREDIPVEIYNKNFHILYDTVHQSTEEWWKTFKGVDSLEDHIVDPNITPERRKEYFMMLNSRLNHLDNKKNHHWHLIPEFFVRLLLTIALEDTAYRELLNIFMMKLQGNMNKAWDPEIQHKFPLYTSKYDQHIPYFIEWINAQKKNAKIEIDNEKGKKEEFNFVANENEIKLLNLYRMTKKQGGGKIIFEVRGETNEKDKIEQDESKSGTTNCEGTSGSDQGEAGTVCPRTEGIPEIVPSENGKTDKIGCVDDKVESSKESS